MLRPVPVGRGEAGFGTRVGVSQLVRSKEVQDGDVRIGCGDSLDLGVLADQPAQRDPELPKPRTHGVEEMAQPFDIKGVAGAGKEQVVVERTLPVLPGPDRWLILGDIVYFERGRRSCGRSMLRFA